MSLRWQLAVGSNDREKLSQTTDSRRPPAADGNCPWAAGGNCLWTMGGGAFDQQGRDVRSKRQVGPFVPGRHLSIVQRPWLTWQSDLPPSGRSGSVRVRQRSGGRSSRRPCRRRAFTRPQSVPFVRRPGGSRPVHKQVQKRSCIPGWAWLIYPSLRPGQRSARPILCRPVGQIILLPSSVIRHPGRA